MGHKHRVHFEYDYMGRRVRKVTYPWDVGTEDWMEAPDSDIRFVYDGWNLVQEIDGLVEVESGVTDVAREYTWGLDLSGQSGNPSPAGIHGAGGIGGLLGTHWTGNTTSTSDDKAYIYFYDANGNVGQMIDVVSGSSGYGTAAAKYEYYPFGGLLAIDGVAAEANPFRFSTKYRDNETRCYYYGRRYLRSKHAKWLNRDPLAEHGGVNLYAFVLNNAPNLIDLFGQQSTQPSRFRPKRLHCCMFNESAIIDEGEANNLEHGLLNEQKGIVFTCRCGWLDVAHMRQAIDKESRINKSYNYSCGEML